MKNAHEFSLDTCFTQLILAYAAGGLPVWFLAFLFHHSLPADRWTTMLTLLLWLLFGFLMGVLFGNVGPVPKGEFKPVSLSDDHAVIAQRLLASVGMSPGYIPPVLRNSSINDLLAGGNAKFSSSAGSTHRHSAHSSG